MKKILLGTAAGLFLTAVNAGDDCGCCDTSFTGVYLGASIKCSFDQNKLEVKNNGAVAYPSTKKNKTGFGGDITVAGLYQFCNGLTVGLSHESSFLSKAKARYEGVLQRNSSWEFSRKLYSPAFFFDLGYSVDNWLIAIRNGLCIEKFKAEQFEGTTSQGTKDYTRTSYAIGAMVKYKMDMLNVFAKVTYKPGKSVIENKGTIKADYKRSAFDVAVGVDFNVTKFIH